MPKHPDCPDREAHNPHWIKDKEGKQVQCPGFIIPTPRKPK